MLVGMNASSIGLVFAACITLFAKFVHNASEAAAMLMAMVLTHRFGVPPPVAIFGCAFFALFLFAVDCPGAYGDWCHVAKYGDIATQHSSCP